MAITVISYAPVGHSYFHTPPAASCHPLAPRGGVAKRRGRMIITSKKPGAYDHFAGGVICANIYIVAFFNSNLISFFPVLGCKYSHLPRNEPEEIIFS